MKKLALLTAASLLFSINSVQAAPKLQQHISGLAGVESVVYDESKGVYFASLQAGDKSGDGSVVVLDSEYRFIATIARGLENPKGIAIKGDTLFVGDMQHLVEVDTRTGSVIKHEVKGGEFLNDVVIDKHGDVYASDMFTSVIYKYSGDKVTHWIDSPALENPNGLLFVNDQLYVAAWGYFNDGNPIAAPFGNVLKIDPKTKSIAKVTNQPLGNLDGLQLDSKGNLLVSDWKQGVVFSVTTKGKVKQLIDLPRGAGDIYYSQKQDKLLIPMALEGEILEYTQVSK